MKIADNLLAIKKTIPENVTLVAVSKTKPNTDILEAYEAGQRIFGENRALELKQKAEDLPKDIEWHFIGHPQSKQVKYFAPFVSLIHGIDSLKLLGVIDKEGQKNQRILKCLLEFHIAEESSKFGLSQNEAEEILANPEFHLLKHVQICGVMGMATYTDDKIQIKREFKILRNIFETLKQNYFADKPYFNTVSMGMSGDYQLAIEEGSTLVRIGSSIFGTR